MTRKTERFYDLMYIRGFLRKIMNDIPCSRPSWVAISFLHQFWSWACATPSVSKRTFSAWPFDHSPSWQISERRLMQRTCMSRDRFLQPHDLTTGPSLASAAGISVCISSYPRALTSFHPSGTGANLCSSGKSVSLTFPPPGSAAVVIRPASLAPCLCRLVACRRTCICRPCER